MSRVLSDLCYTEGGRYRFVLTANLRVNLKLGLRGFHVLQDRGTTRATLDDDTLEIRKGYAFDGCSPAYRVFGKWVGVPTPDSAVAASAVHDCLRGFLHLPCLRYSLEDTDAVFKAVLEEEGFDHSELYHAAVAGPLGRAYHRLTSAKQSDAKCRHHLPLAPVGCLWSCKLSKLAIA